MNLRQPHISHVKAVLGPTNTGKTHLAIERMCAHSSGAMGFPLRLLAREVYDRVVKIKGEGQVALITGEERIEPPNARYFLCTAEAMPRRSGPRRSGPRRSGFKSGSGLNGDFAFVALDEAQLAGHRERGHIFTDHFLHTRGREETMLLGAATLAPLVRTLLPQAEIIQRPRFSTLTHIGPRKLSRLPPRSAIVAFSSEQVYAVAEMLRRFRGGAAVVMGALSPETRNRQVELFQSGEVDYIVATDAIGMGLNLDINHVAFASLTKFDGMKQRRLLPAEMAQIAGRAGRHQRDGTFGTLSGIGAGSGMGAGSRTGGRTTGADIAPAEFTDEEIYAIEEHRFAPLTHLFWRDSQPRFDTLPVLIGDLERIPDEPQLRAMPDTVDLTVLKRLAEDPIADGIKGAGQIRRFWEVCSLPDFRQQGAETHSRFVARLWQDLRGGYLGADYVAARIAELDNMQGDIHTLQGRIAAIRSWAYICQRPDWVLARDEMADRARKVEAKLSDALHGRLTERFVNRRTALLMKSLGQDASLLPVTLNDDGALCVEDEMIGTVSGFRFKVDHTANHADRKMLLSAGEKALPRILGEKARKLAESDLSGLSLSKGAIWWQEIAQAADAESGAESEAQPEQAAAEKQRLASLELSDNFAQPKIVLSDDLKILTESDRAILHSALSEWLTGQLTPIEPLAKMALATRDEDAGSQARALLLTLISGHGFISREKAGLEHLPKEMRPFLRRLGITFGALDIFAPALLKPAPRQILHAIGADRRPLVDAMFPVVPAEGKLPAGYRPAGAQFIRLDIAEKILKAAYEARSKTTQRRFIINPALAISIGLTPESFKNLLGAAGFRLYPARTLPENTFGPPQIDRWEWRPPRNKKQKPQRKPAPPRNNGGAFAALADLMG